MAVNWDKVLEELLEKLIELFIPWAAKTLGKVIEGAYNRVEDWADRQHLKPAGDKKMAAAVALVQMAEPDIDGSEARLLIEAHHIRLNRRERRGKTSMAA